MAYPNYPYPGYQPVPNYYPGPVPDQLAQLRQNQMQQIPPNMIQPAPNLVPQPQARDYLGQRQSGGGRLSGSPQQRRGALGRQQPGDLSALRRQHREAIYKGL